MKEIEVLKELYTDIETSKNKLNNSTYVGCQTTIDTYYYDPLRNNLKPNESNQLKECFRTRKKHNKYYITYKIDKYDEEGKWLYSDEYETLIGSIKVIEQIIKQLGLKELLTIKNKKTEYINDEYSIVLEEVENLGNFIEVEKCTDEDIDVKREKQRIEKFMKGLNLETSQELYLGKPEMMLKKQLKEKTCYNNKGGINMRLKDKVAIITGGSTGIGYAITEAYLREGAKVVIASYDKKEIDDAIDTLCEKYDRKNIFGVSCNVKNTSDIKEVVQKTIEKYDRIDILINNAGITNSGPTESVTDEAFENMFEVNTFGVFKFIREVIPYMKKQGQGSIINTSSMVANDGSRMQTAYTASKYAVNGITKACAKELGAYGIRVNAVAPGAVLTNMVKKATTEEMRQMLCKTCALGKIAEPKELAGAYVYLGSDEASYTTGSIVRVDGGPF